MYLDVFAFDFLYIRYIYLICTFICTSISMLYIFLMYLIGMQTPQIKASFLQFDIENSYLSITSDLLHNSIKFAKEVTVVSDNDLHIFMQSTKTLLFNEKTMGETVWQ